MNKRPKEVTRPVISIDDGKTQLYVLDVGQHVKLAEHHSQQYFAGKTASLVYVERSHGLRSEESHIDNPQVWAWLRKWMFAGLRAYGHMQPEPGTPDLRTAAKAIVDNADNTGCDGCAVVPQWALDHLRAALDYQPPQDKE